MTKIENIIFDLGGVILNIDYSLPIVAFTKLGAQNFERLYSQANQEKLFDKFDKGLLSPAKFRNGLRKLININLNDNEIDDAWNAILLDFPAENITLLKKVKQNYRSFLLSNTLIRERKIVLLGKM